VSHSQQAGFASTQDEAIAALTQRYWHYLAMQPRIDHIAFHWAMDMAKASSPDLWYRPDWTEIVSQALKQVAGKSLPTQASVTKEPAKGQTELNL